MENTAQEEYFGQNYGHYVNRYKTFSNEKLIKRSELIGSHLDQTGGDQEAYYTSLLIVSVEAKRRGIHCLLECSAPYDRI